jgi:hypothetical protein
VYTAEDEINNLRDVKLGIAFSSEFAYMADGNNGLCMVQLTSPETPDTGGVSPKPKSETIATYNLPRGSEAPVCSEAPDRDRAVGESGNQIAVFDRVGESAEVGGAAEVVLAQRPDLAHQRRPGRSALSEATHPTRTG